ncbi:MAG: hypothetical protein MUQ30_15160, partial [Anaerolineae bacterium]|nr:hypothetical protein [Anaerolineae bacterium]
MSETVRRMLVHGIAAAHAGETAEARRYLERVLYLDADREQLTKAHLWLSRLVTDRAEQREHLEGILAADPTHGEAQRALALLNGTLSPVEIVDPDHPPNSSLEVDAESKPRPIAAQRTVCPQCGGRIHFEPGKSSVQCRYCGHRQPIRTALRAQTALREENFIVALATAKGHTVPEGLRSLRCQGCQATLLTSGELSTHCPYCGSAHIVEVDTQAAIEPEGLIAFVVAEDDAEAAFREWLGDQMGNNRERLAHVHTTRLRGIYLPIWTFDLMGEVGWRGSEPEDRRRSNGALISISEGGIHFRIEGQGNRIGAREGTHYVLVDDAIVPASHKVPFALREVFELFDLSRAVPYEPAFLSDWPAETYEVAVGDASLVARRQVLEEAGADIRIKATMQAGDVQNLQTFSRSLS